MAVVAVIFMNIPVTPLRAVDKMQHIPQQTTTLHVHNLQY